MTGSGMGAIWRKAGWPVLVLAYGLIHGCEWWRILVAVFLAVFAVTRPFTYYGSDVRGSAFNWAWIWILGLYFSGPMVALGKAHLWPLAWSLAATLSNIKKTSGIFTWEFCECLCGVSVLL
jgi:hypothetical protein